MIQNTKLNNSLEMFWFNIMNFLFFIQNQYEAMNLVCRWLFMHNEQIIFWRWGTCCKDPTSLGWLPSHLHFYRGSWDRSRCLPLRVRRPGWMIYRHLQSWGQLQYCQLLHFDPYRTCLRFFLPRSWLRLCQWGQSWWGWHCCFELSGF